MPKQTGRRLLVQRQLLTTVLNEATWKDGMLRTTLLEQRKLNKSEWEGWVGTGRDFEDWLPGRTRTCDLMRVKRGVHSTSLIVLAQGSSEFRSNDCQNSNDRLFHFLILRLSEIGR